MPARFKVPAPPSRNRYLTALGLSVVTAVFIGVVLYGILTTHAESTISHPRLEPEWVDQRTKLDKAPEDEQQIQRLQETDRDLRQIFFTHRSLLDSGRIMLWIAAMLFLFAAKDVMAWHLQPPAPELKADAEAWQELRVARARLSVSIISIAIGIAAGFGALALEDKAEQQQAAADKAAAQAKEAQKVVFPKPEEIAQQWAGFRGPGSTGTTQHTGILLDFDGKSGKNILWKKPVPLPGKNSPVLWNGRLFLSGATNKKREVYCFDVANGNLLWQRNISVPNPFKGKDPKPMKDTGYAAPTVSTDGRRVCACFANGDLVCLDYKSGKMLWGKNLSIPDNPYGHSASLIMWQDRVLIQWDQGVTGEKKKKPSKILALHLRDGALLWEAKRPVGASWSSPIIISTPSGYQLVTCSNPLVIAYDPSKGNELWRAEVLEGDGGPSPSYAKGLVYAANVDSYLACIRPDGRGEVTKSHVVWKAEEGLPDICSILTDGRHVWLLETAGALTCYDAKAGRQLYLQDVLGEDMSFVSSPTLVGDKLMLIGESGKVLIVSTGPKFKQLGISDLGEDCETCPAFAKGRMYIRGQKHLFCIGAKD